MCGPRFCSMKIHGHLSEIAARDAERACGQAAPASGPLQVLP
jgi:phosphomethylpyrimidine synthase